MVFATKGSTILLLLISRAAARHLTDPRALGYNVVNLQSGNFSLDAAYADTTAKVLHAGVLRYPGGNLADFWDWKAGWCVATTQAPGCPQCRNPCQKKRVARPYTLTEFALAVRRTSSRSVLMLNMLTDTLASQLEYLGEAQRLGLLDASTYVELGGEFYWGKFAGRWSSGQAYATEANHWAAAIKARFPHVSTVAMAAHAINMPRPPSGSSVEDRMRSWNQELYAGVSEDIDGVSIHPYLHLGDDFIGGGPLQPGVPPRAPGEGPIGWSHNASVQRRFVDEVLRSEQGMELLLGVPFFVAGEADGSIATHAKLPPRLRMIITEYNVMERAGPFKSSWAHALFISAAALNLLAIPQVDAVLLHVLLNGYGWGALYETTNDFEPDGTPPAGSAATGIGTGDRCLLSECMHLRTSPYSPTAVGVVLGAMSAALSGATSASVVATPNATNRSGAMPGGLPGKITYPSMIAMRVDGSEATRYIVLSLTPHVQSFTPAASKCAWKEAHAFASPDASGSPAAWASESTPVRSKRHMCTEEAAITLDPYSLTVVTMQGPGEGAAQQTGTNQNAEE